MSEERREAHRHDCQVPIRYVRGGQRILEGKALDISATGARLLLPEAASSPQNLTLELDGQLALLAKTVWSERLPSGSRMVGVTFQGLSYGQRAVLENYLSSLSRLAA
jgi:hypothetical protein